MAANDLLDQLEEMNERMNARIFNAFKLSERELSVVMPTSTERPAGMVIQGGTIRVKAHGTVEVCQEDIESAMFSMPRMDIYRLADFYSMNPYLTNTRIVTENGAVFDVTRVRIGPNVEHEGVGMLAPEAPRWVQTTGTSLHPNAALVMGQAIVAGLVDLDSVNHSLSALRQVEEVEGIEEVADPNEVKTDRLAPRRKIEI